MMILAIIAAFTVGSIATSGMAYAAEKPNGAPFQALWDAIAGLQSQIDDISATTGPQGEQGEPGPQGEQGEPGPQGESGTSESIRILREHKVVTIPTESFDFSSVPANITCSEGNAISGTAYVLTSSITEDPGTFFETWAINGEVVSDDTFSIVSDRTKSSNGYQLELQVICLVQ
jgi:hypothetical protein